MTERIDRVAEATETLNIAVFSHQEPLHEVTAVAHVQALIAIAEQQRIANLIEYMRLVNSDPSQATDLTPEIAAALGVDQ